MSFENAFGLDEYSLRLFLETNICMGCDLSNADLSASALSGADLFETNLSNTDLSSASDGDRSLFSTIVRVRLI